MGLSFIHRHIVLPFIFQVAGGWAYSFIPITYRGKFIEIFLFAAVLHPEIDGV
jgi:hypothetical protein